MGNTRSRPSCSRASAVHPHVRGEYSSKNRCCHGWNGSPPRAWGILQCPLPSQCRLRFTPTCVGNTQYSILIWSSNSVHPHVRGEYLTVTPQNLLTSGSPPRAWGIRGCGTGFQPVVRFTPTCVGNTPPCSSSVIPISVHPHVRGEYSSRGVVTATPSGSPPRAWGILRGLGSDERRSRFTPTCVGNTIRPTFPAARVAVHPHVRGEYPSDLAERRIEDGSPPRAWGIRVDGGDSTRGPRFTPTCVGNTDDRDMLFRIHAVHPHVRGEYQFRQNRVASSPGSPPRAWGIRGERLCPHACDRFTPTCVGNTAVGWTECDYWSVHPHVRGEYFGNDEASTTSSGSPPRAWGIPAAGSVPAAGLRFTPTCVGNTVIRQGYIPATPVHPHVRGEYRRRDACSPGACGSPPRAWGIRPLPGHPLALARFTPTCVGNTDRLVESGPAPPVHPHVRGEYRLRETVQVDPAGSPPRAWGIHQPAFFRRLVVRFTPTCVGNTCSRRLWVAQASVHPHVRGEYAFGQLDLRQLRGSPPRAWGIQDIEASLADLGRFTPTCVGNTRPGPHTSTRRPVHPHVRGEYSGDGWITQEEIGSPPRAWGIPRYSFRRLVASRFTPTCVGNTYQAFSGPPAPSGSPPRAWGILLPDAGTGTLRRFTPTCVGNTVS